MRIISRPIAAAAVLAMPMMSMLGAVAVVSVPAAFLVARASFAKAMEATVTLSPRAWS